MKLGLKFLRSFRYVMCHYYSNSNEVTREEKPHILRFLFPNRPKVRISLSANTIFCGLWIFQKRALYRRPGKDANEVSYVPVFGHYFRQRLVNIVLAKYLRGSSPNVQHIVVNRKITVEKPFKISTPSIANWLMPA